MIASASGRGCRYVLPPSPTRVACLVRNCAGALIENWELKIGNWELVIGRLCPRPAEKLEQEAEEEGAGAAL